MQPWIMLWSIDICQIKLSADQYHVTISRAQAYSLSRSCVLLKLTADQVLVFHWIAGSCQVQLLKQSWVVRKPVNSNPGLKVNQITTVSSVQFFLVAFVLCIGFVIIKLEKAKQYTENLMPLSYKTQIKIRSYPGLAKSGYISSAFRMA